MRDPSGRRVAGYAPRPADRTVSAPRGVCRCSAGAPMMLGRRASGRAPRGEQRRKVDPACQVESERCTGVTEGPDRIPEAFAHLRHRSPAHCGAQQSGWLALLREAGLVPGGRRRDRSTRPTPGDFAARPGRHGEGRGTAGHGSADRARMPSRRQPRPGWGGWPPGWAGWTARAPPQTPPVGWTPGTARRATVELPAVGRGLSGGFVGPVIDERPGDARTLAACPAHVC